MGERPGVDERRKGTAGIVALLDQLLPDERIRNDCYAVLREGAEDGMTEIELGAEWRPVPITAPIVVVTKAFFNQRFNTGFGTSYRAQVASAMSLRTLWEQSTRGSVSPRSITATNAT